MTAGNLTNATSKYTLAAQTRIWEEIQARLVLRVDAEDEEKNRVYDRQIRLWGADAQQRIMASRVLFVGLGAVSVELCKNLVLAGFSATVSDDAVVEPAALGYNFFVDEGALGVVEAQNSDAARVVAAVRHERFDHRNHCCRLEGVGERGAVPGLRMTEVDEVERRVERPGGRDGRGRPERAAVESF